MPGPYHHIMSLDLPSAPVLLVATGAAAEAQPPSNDAELSWGSGDGAGPGVGSTASRKALVRTAIGPCSDELVGGDDRQQPARRTALVREPLMSTNEVVVL